MPERLPYDEAMIFSAARLKIQDSELKRGKVEMVRVQTKMGLVVRPYAMEGGFAVVYKFRTNSGQYRALRCFRVPMPPDMQLRYERIGAYFATHIPDITAHFKYHEQGILVKENMGGQLQSAIYPLIEMEWIDGVTLLEKVDELCKKREHTEIHNLVNRWIALLLTMRQNYVAHGDLSATDVMVRANGQLVLIDYDGVYVPDLVGS